ncbi:MULTISPECIES: hypothetical protein [unclassified Streptomyces]|nr:MULTISPECIES: hypothetical protein [unclassified Streptomyces]MCX4650221.1 hypothetical protein [Streptomyces sp. NBC_01446]MCX5327783.1 hypothetical protein [Streptomyces sp. NBC_00120]
MSVVIQRPDRLHRRHGEPPTAPLAASGTVDLAAMARADQALRAVLVL